MPRLNLTFRPIDVWPRQLTVKRQPSRFESSWSATQALLEKEIRALKRSSPTARIDAVVQLAVPAGAIRQDGGLAKGRQAPEHPGVILSFEGADRPYRFACDQFTSRGYRNTLDGWQTNMRAIALGMESLRRLDRYGIAAGGEQYVGFEALPAGRAMPAGGNTMTVQAAAEILAAEAIDPAVSATPIFTAAELLSQPVARVSAYRMAVRRLHPDQGGEPAAFVRLNTARDVLGEYVHS